MLWRWTRASPAGGLLDRAIERFGKPQTIRCDNGPELCSRHFLAWSIERKIDVLHIRPGKPAENAYVESFHGRLRDECLNTSWYWNLAYRTPNEFAQQWQDALQPDQQPFQQQNTDQETEIRL